MYDVNMMSESKHALENWEIVILFLKYREKNDFCVRNHENMWF